MGIPAAVHRFGRAAPLARRLWPFFLFALATGVYHVQILASPPDRMVDAIDIRSYLLYVHQYSRDSLLAGRLPLWNPYSYAGVPFVANPQTTVFYPPSWLYLAMPVIQADKWIIALHVFLTGSFMYLFLRRVGVRQASAVVASLPWMFGSYFAARACVGHLTLLFTAAWIPLALYCGERAFAEGRLRWAFWTGFVLGVQFLAGGDQNCYYTALALAVYGAVRSWMGRDDARIMGSRVNTSGVSQSAIRNPKSEIGTWFSRFGFWAGRLAVVGAVAVLTSGVQLLPTAEMALHSDRAANSYVFATGYSFNPASLPVFLLPWSDRLLGLGLGADGPCLDLSWEWAGYIGIVPLALAAIALGMRGRAPLAALRIVLLLAVVLMLGRYTFVYEWLYAALPGLKFFRNPGRAVVLVAWALCALSGFGLDWLLDEARSRWRGRAWRIPTAVALTGLAGLVAAAIALLDIRKPPGFFQAATLPVGLDDPVILTAILILLASAAGVVALRWMSRPIALATLIALIAADLLSARPMFPLAHYSPARDGSIRKLRALGDRLGPADHAYRVNLSSAFVEPDAAIAARMENVNGYWPVALGRFYRYVHAITGVEPDPQRRHALNEAVFAADGPCPLAILNVRAASRIVGSVASRPDTAGRRASGDPPASQPADTRPDHRMELYVADPFPPRAWVVHQAEVIVDETDTLARMKQKDFDPARLVLLEKPPRIKLTGQPSSPGRVTVQRVEGGGLEMRTDTASDGYLVLSEVFYPGWRAKVDGRAVAVERADSVVTALPLPAGAHTVTYHFDPLSVKLGLLLTAIGVLSALAHAGASTRRRPAERPSAR